jgi:hypothetical protein
MNKIKVIVIIFVLFFLQCTEKYEKSDANKSAYPVREEILDGVKTIMNPDYPRDGLFRYKMADVLTLGKEEEPEEAILFFPYKIRVDSNNNIYVLDAEDMNIKIYDSHGKWIRNVGRRGQGPGEYMSINDFDVSGDGRIFISDIRQRRVSILCNDGSFVFNFLVEGSCGRLRVDTEDRVYLEQFVSFSPKGTSGSRDQEIIIKRTNSRGENLIEYGKFPAGKFVWRPKRENDGLHIISHTSQDAYSTSWIVDKSGRIYLCNNRDYLISILNQKGKPIFRFGREFTKIKHPLYSPDLAHPEYYPAFYSRYFFFDDEENLWLKIYAESSETVHLYDVFSPQGIFIRQAVVPEKILFYQNEKAYTIIETEDGDYVAKCYKLVKN